MDPLSLSKELNQILTAFFFSPPGGCQRDETGPQEAAATEEQASDDSLATAAIISEDPHAVLVEFSSVVADTQEYIIKVSRQLSRFYYIHINRNV